MLWNGESLVINLERKCDWAQEQETWSPTKQVQFTLFTYILQFCVCVNI